MKILLISDVHRNINLMNQIIKENKDCDLNFFLGDFEIINRQKQSELTKKFNKSVQGNCDLPNISSITEIIKIEDVNILLTHGHHFGSWFKKIDFIKLFSYAKSKNIDLILHGHDHIAAKETKDGITRFNPGSISYPRMGEKPSYGILEINGKDFTLKHIYL